jgi:hypothetical protein
MLHGCIYVSMCHRQIDVCGNTYNAVIGSSQFAFSSVIGVHYFTNPGQVYPDTMCNPKMFEAQQTLCTGGCRSNIPVHLHLCGQKLRESTVSTLMKYYRNTETR